MSSNPADISGQHIHSILSRISFLGGFTADELSLITGHFTETSYAAGDFIIRKGERPTHLYIIISGQVELHIADKNKDIHKRTCEAGDHFGEVAMLSLVNETASFVAVDDCTLLSFPFAAFYSLRKESPDLFGRIVLNLARDLARKVQYSDDLMLRGRVKTSS